MIHLSGLNHAMELLPTLVGASPYGRAPEAHCAASTSVTAQRTGCIGERTGRLSQPVAARARTRRQFELQAPLPQRRFRPAPPSPARGLPPRQVYGRRRSNGSNPSAAILRSACRNSLTVLRALG